MSMIIKFEDFKKNNEEYEMDFENSEDISEEYAMAIIARAFDNSKNLESIDIQAAFDEICEDNYVTDERAEYVKGSVIDMLVKMKSKADIIKLK